MKREQEKEVVGLTSSVHCKQSSSKAIDILHCDMQHEYNENNLFFYCFSYNTKTKRLSPLPKGISKLVSNCCKS